MRLNPVLQVRESNTTFNLSFLNSKSPFAAFKKVSFNIHEKDYKPIIERLGKSKGLNHPYLKDNINSKILEILLNADNEMSINEMINLSNQLIALRINYSTLEELKPNDLSSNIDLLIIDIRSMNVPPNIGTIINEMNIGKTIFINRISDEFIVGPLVNNSGIVCFNCLISSVIKYKNQIISVERNENRNLLASQIIEFLLNQNLFTNFLSNGQIMIKNGVDYKTSYRVPFETTSCKYLVN